MSKSYDLVVIGSGPGGYVAAIRAAQLGLKTAVVEREHLGGICLNWGCIPTKALLKSSEVNHLLHHASDYGFTVGEIKFDIKKIVERSRGIAKQLSAGINHLLKKNKVDIIMGYGRLAGNGKVDVDNNGAKETITAKHIIIATGARARTFPNLQPNGKTIVTYKDAMTPDAMPKSLLVVGSGAIGIEFASFYQNMGASVTVVELLDRVLPVEDKEISDFARKQFEKQGMKIMTGASVKELKEGNGSVTATIDVKGKTENITVEKVIIAVGIVPNTEDIGLDKTKIKTDRGHIKVNQWLETDEKGVYAIGDVVGAPWLAHKASHEGVICVEKIAGVKDVHPLDVTNIPGCTYCRPQIASVGYTEEKAKELGHKVKVGRFSFIGNGKAIAIGEAEGLIKTIFDEKTGELLGAHMIGPEVTEMIQGYGIAKTLETTESELMHTVFAHPTLSEAMHESVLDAYGKMIHL